MDELEKVLPRWWKNWNQVQSKEWLKDLGMFSLQKGRLKEDMIAAFTYLNGTRIVKGLDIPPCSRRYDKTNETNFKDVETDYI